MKTGGGIPAWCVAHPIGTVLLTAALVLLGAMAYPLMPTAPLPQVEYPTIEINARLPGASAETIASSVATPLEVELSAIPGVTEMTSTSRLGSVEITMQFVLNKPINEAAQEVQSAINAAANRLPNDMPGPPTWRKRNPADRPVLMLAVTSETLSLTEVSDYAETFLARQLSRIEGVGDVTVTGQQRPAIRIRATPERLTAAGLTMADIRTAVRNASVNLPKGELHGRHRVSTLATNDQIFSPEGYGDLIITYRDGAPVRLRDVARVELGAENQYVRAWPLNTSGVGVYVRRQPDANIVETINRVQAALPGLQAMLPPSIQVQVDNDRSRTIRSSLHEVQITLAIAITLVLGVMMVFLKQLSATLVVSAVLGVTLAATGACMYLAGFSLNNLTLVAIVVSVGFIVDDAIVVVENIHRHLENGATRAQAALRAIGEIGGTVVSIGISLCAAFIPLLFMDGIIGRLFREFALTATFAILISVAVSLTLAPTLAALFMNAPRHAKAASAGTFDRLQNLYGRGLSWALARPRIMLSVFALSIATSVTLFAYIPKGFFPQQDTGMIIVRTLGAPDISFEELVDKHQQLARILAEEPGIEHFTHAAGTQGRNGGMAWLSLADPSDRDFTAQQLMDRLRPKLTSIPGLQIFMQSMQDINIGGGANRAQYLYVLRATDSQLLNIWGQRLTEKLASMPAFQDVSTDLEGGATVTRLSIDREAAARFGLSVVDIDNALYDAFGQRQINEYQTESNQYKVILEIDHAQRGSVESLSYFHLRSPLSGELVPLSAVTHAEPPETGLLSITHDGMLPAANISFNLATGVALGDAVRDLQRAESEIGMPSSISGSFQGAAKVFQDSLSTQPLLILAAMLALYIILGVLYESFIHPLTILSTLPAAGIGALLLLWVSGHDLSIMALIGLVLLIGVVKKNGILMIDFALDAQRRLGLSARDAIHQACLVRFRPILMTTLAALLGAVPLMLGVGTGSELRQPLGVAIVGGLAVSQLLTLFTTPVVYVALDRMFHRRSTAAPVTEVARSG